MTNELSPALEAQRSVRQVLASLEPKQLAYVEARLRGSVPVVAARLAGYANPDEKAGELEASHLIRTAMTLKRRIEQYEDGITRADVLNWLQEAKDLAANSMEITAAAREVAKIIGANAPVKVEHGGTVKVTQEQIQKLSDEDLAKMAAIDAEFERVPDAESGIAVNQPQGEVHE